MDPRDMLNLIRRDFESNHWAFVVLCVTLALGLLCWLPAFAARHSLQQALPIEQ